LTLLLEREVQDLFDTGRHRGSQVDPRRKAGGIDHFLRRRNENIIGRIDDANGGPDRETIPPDHVSDRHSARDTMQTGLSRISLRTRRGHPGRVIHFGFTHQEGCIRHGE
jgi:hypothetical protein